MTNLIPQKSQVHHQPRLLVARPGELCASTALLALTLPVDGFLAMQLTGTVPVPLLVLGVLGTGAAYVINYALITTEGPRAARVIIYLVPTVSVALGAPVLSEPTGPNILAGTVLILLDVALVQGRRPKPTATRRSTMAGRRPRGREW